ncbi:hypothetical protein B0H11DRAFT_2189432 [Mycena galericulata]|nr:hypothetical protein B0H11DRAFT_2189432 [Mycena galericulata]
MAHKKLVLYPLVGESAGGGSWMGAGVTYTIGSGSGLGRDRVSVPALTAGCRRNTLEGVFRACNAGVYRQRESSRKGSQRHLQLRAVPLLPQLRGDGAGVLPWDMKIVIGTRRRVGWDHWRWIRLFPQEKTMLSPGAGGGGWRFDPVNMTACSAPGQLGMHGAEMKGNKLQQRWLKIGAHYQSPAGQNESLMLQKGQKW